MQVLTSSSITQNPQKTKKREEEKKSDLVADLDAVHDVKTKNATEDGPGNDPDVTPFLRTRRPHH